MKLRCKLRDLRGEKTLKAISEQTGINRGTLSLIELGRLVPKDELLPALVDAYGRPVEDWYSPHALLALEEDEGA